MKDKQKVVAGSARTKVRGAASKVQPDKAEAEMHRKMRRRLTRPGRG